MTEFPKLESVLRKWVNEATSRLSADGEASYGTTDLGHWRRDSDGVFRDAERVVETWDRKSVNILFELPQWTAVLDELYADDRLKVQVDTLVGTAQGGHRIEVTHIGRIVLPRPNELTQFNESFEKRYAELEDFLARDEIEYTVIWPLPGLVSVALPVQLEPALELDVMSDRELGFALDVGVVRTDFPRDRILVPQTEHRTCVRYHFKLPKLVGDRNVEASNQINQEIWDKLDLGYSLNRSGIGSCS